MSELQNFPMVSQLNAPTSDGRPSENKWFDCVPASIAAGLMWLTGKQFNPDQLKDAAYGEAWANEGTAASAYVGFCDQQGVSLVSRSDGDLIDIAHAELAAGHPVIFTQQDDYAPPGNPDWTHVCVWYKDRPGFLTAMDPFIAQPLEYDDNTWRNRMRAGDVWIMAKKNEGDLPVIDIHSPLVSNYFDEVDGSHWHCKRNGNTISFGILGYYKRSNGLLMYGLPLTNELYPMPGVAMQIFERGVIVYDPQKKFDNPPGSTDCYPGHINVGPAFDFLAQALKAQIVDLTNQVSNYKAQLATAIAAGTDLQALKAKLATAEQALADAVAAIPAPAAVS